MRVCVAIGVVHMQAGMDEVDRMRTLRQLFVQDAHQCEGSPLTVVECGSGALAHALLGGGSFVRSH